MTRGMQQDSNHGRGIRSSGRAVKSPTHSDGTKVNGFSSKPTASILKSPTHSDGTNRRSSGRRTKASSNHDGTTKKNYNGSVAHTKAVLDATALKGKKERERKAKQLKENEEAKQLKEKEEAKQLKEQLKVKDKEDKEAKQLEDEKQLEELKAKEEKEKEAKQLKEQAAALEQEQQEQERARVAQQAVAAARQQQQVPRVQSKGNQRQLQYEAAQAAKKEKVLKMLDKLSVGSTIQTFECGTDYNGKNCVVKEFDRNKPYLVIVKYDGDDADEDVREVNLMSVYDFELHTGKSDGEDSEYVQDDSDDDKSSTGTARTEVSEVVATSTTNKTDIILKGIQDQMNSLQDHILNKPKKKGDGKRPIASHAISVEQMKDEVVRGTHDIAVKYVEQLVWQSQWKDVEERNYHPKFWNVMLNVDGLILDPNKPGADGRKDRESPVVNIFGQEDIPIKEFANILKRTAKKMLKGNKEGWTMTSDSEEFARNTYGERLKKAPKKQHTIVAAMESEKIEREEKAAAAALLGPHPVQKQGETGEL